MPPRPALPPVKTILLRNQDYLCIYCDKELSYNKTVIDHFEPFVYIEHKTKFFASCIQCNQIKSCKVFQSIGEAREFIQQRKNSIKEELSRMPARILPKKETSKILSRRMPLVKLVKKEPKKKIISAHPPMLWKDQCKLLYLSPYRLKNNGVPKNKVGVP